jgi:hypothetical protein
MPPRLLEVLLLQMNLAQERLQFLDNVPRQFAKAGELG